MKRLIAIFAALFVATQAYAQSDPASGTVFLPSCQAALDVASGKRPAADSPEAAGQLRRATQCLAAINAILNVQPFLQREYAACANTAITPVQAIQTVTAYLKAHPDQLAENFHALAVRALAAQWSCKG